MLIYEISPDTLTQSDGSSNIDFRNGAGKPCLSRPVLTSFDVTATSALPSQKLARIVIEATLGFNHTTMADGTGAPATCTQTLSQMIDFSVDPTSNTIKPPLTLGITESADTVDTVGSNGSHVDNQPKFTNSFAFAYQDCGRYISVAVTLLAGVQDIADPYAIELGSFNVFFNA
jgi:hypothetical protein